MIDYDPTPFRPSVRGVPVLRLDEEGRRKAAERVELARRGIADDGAEFDLVRFWRDRRR